MNRYPELGLDRFLDPNHVIVDHQMDDNDHDVRKYKNDVGDLNVLIQLIVLRYLIWPVLTDPMIVDIVVHVDLR